MGARRPAGFTLLELLAALVVLGFVLVMLSQSLRFGVVATARVEGERWQDLLAAEGAIRHLVEQADPGIFPEPAGLRGGADSLSLLTELPGACGPARRADVQLLVAGGRLVLRWCDHRHVHSFGREPAMAETVLLPSVDSVELDYSPRGGPGGWSSSWSADELPGYVRLRIRFTPASGLHWPPMILPTLREPIEG